MKKKLTEGNNNQYLDIAAQALQLNREEDPKESQRKKPGRPVKEDAVKRTDHRLSIYINKDLYSFWKERNEKTNSSMANVINMLLYEEMERIKHNEQL